MSYLLANGSEVTRLTLEHLQISLLACVLASLIALPIGVLISRRRRLAGPVVGTAGVLYTVPSVALFALLIPVLGLGIKTAVVALVLYSQLVLIRNTAVGINEVDPALREASRGMGMTGAQQFWRLELPLALPVIFAGLRATTVMAIGLTSIAAYIGAGGLGVLIFQGISTGHTQQILTGAVLVSLLAFAADGVLAGAERLLRATVGVHA